MSNTVDTAEIVKLFKMEFNELKGSIDTQLKNNKVEIVEEVSKKPENNLTNYYNCLLKISNTVDTAEIVKLFKREFNEFKGSIDTQLKNNKVEIVEEVSKKLENNLTNYNYLLKMSNIVDAAEIVKLFKREFNEFKGSIDTQLKNNKVELVEDFNKKLEQVNGNLEKANNKIKELREFNEFKGSIDTQLKNNKVELVEDFNKKLEQVNGNLEKANNKIKELEDVVANLKGKLEEKSRGQSAEKKINERKHRKNNIAIGNKISLIPENKISLIPENKILNIIPNPLLKVQQEMLKQIQTDHNPEAFNKWIEENVDAKYHKDSGFITALMTVILKFVTQKTTLVEGTDIKKHPEKSLTEKEKILFQKYCHILEAFVTGNTHLQLISVYALQVFCDNAEYPKGMLLRWFKNLYESNVVQEEVFFRWREEVNEVNKGYALFQVHTWLTWLEQAESEEDC